MPKTDVKLEEDPYLRLGKIKWCKNVYRLWNECLFRHTKVYDDFNASFILVFSSCDVDI